jgi:hypothetical protein
MVELIIGRTFPTAASPSKTSLTLLLGLGAEAPPVAGAAMLMSGYNFPKQSEW